MIRSAYADGVISLEESSDIIWLCNNFVSDASYYDLTTSSIQFLFGLLHGIMADGELTNEEIKHLQTWLTANSFLSDAIHLTKSKVLYLQFFWTVL